MRCLFAALKDTSQLSNKYIFLFLFFIRTEDQLNQRLQNLCIRFIFGLRKYSDIFIILFVRYSDTIIRISHKAQVASTIRFHRDALFFGLFLCSFSQMVDAAFCAQPVKS